VLRTTFEALLKLLHPILPFITSELYEALGHERQLAVSAWPQVDDGLLDETAERDFDVVRQAVGGIRALRADADLAPSQTIPVHVAGEASAALLSEREVAASLARAELEGEPPHGAALTQVVPGLELKLPLAGLVDEAEWRGKQQRRLEKLRADRDRSERKLANGKFTANAPEAVVAEERRRLAEAEDLIERIEAAVGRLGDGG
jgi:valyl-tRNA synthetase